VGGFKRETEIPGQDTSRVWNVQEIHRVSREISDMGIDIKDIEIAINMIDPERLVDGCQCDPEVGHICESCFIHSVLCDCKREIERLRDLWDAAIECEGTDWADDILEIGCEKEVSHEGDTRKRL
jgi:hypothetical protein